MKKIVSILLVCVILFTTVFIANAETKYTDIPFNGQGNSKLFLTYGDNDFDYVDYVDYSGWYGYDDGYITDESIPDYIPYAVCISPNGMIGDTALVFDANGNWNLYGIPFHIAVNEKAVKLMSIKGNTSSMSEIQKAQIQSMTSHRMILEPKAYSRIYFLAFCTYGVNEVTIDVTYSDGTEEEKFIEVTNQPYEIDWSWTTRERYDLGYTIAKSAEGTATTDSGNGRYFYPYSITVDPNKEVAELNFSVGAATRAYHIISMTGVKPDAEDIAEYAKTFTEVTEKNYNDAKFYVKQSTEFGVPYEDVKSLDELVKAYEKTNGIEEKTEGNHEEPVKPELEVKGEMQFEDLDSVSWAVDAIKYLYENNVVSGTTDKTFSPDDHLTREQFVKIICEAFDIPESGKAVTFKDVKKGQWYENYVKNACGAGLVSGTSKDTFGVGEKITRQDLAVIIYRAVGDKLKAEGKTPEFADRIDVDGYAIAAVTTLAKAGILNGSEGRLNPKNYCTRAEMAKIIYSVIRNIEGN